jgi:predicted aminopeptidase
VRRKNLLIVLAIVSLGVLLSGCQNVSYYTQAIGGQARILGGQRSLHAMLADTNTPTELQEKFKLILNVRQFAERELELPAKNHYLRYADIKRRYVVWNVQATPEFSFQPVSWWFPLVGNASYRGYFSEDAARAYARQLEREGLEVYVGGVEAYSTLGWFADPVLNTFVDRSDVDLAELVFHELAHQRVFASGDTAFNEAFATAVAEEGLRRWIIASGNLKDYAEYQKNAARHEQFVDLVFVTRSELKRLYTDREARRDPETLRARKKEIIDGMVSQYDAMKLEWGGYKGYDRWFSGPLNNAQLGTVSTYHSLVPAFNLLLRKTGGDLPKFYGQVHKLSRLAKGDRHIRLQQLLAEAQRHPPAGDLAATGE